MTQQSLFDAVDEREAQAPSLIGAVELSRLLGQPHPPTAEQARAIEHLGTDGELAPYLVVAGAGSGKTETMAARVVWLVANRLVRPERILGLTFTRKAAGELAQRVRARLGQLARSGLLPADPDDDWLAAEPTVATYHSYAAGLFGEHALRIGREPSARLLGEAVTWQYAGRVVNAHGGDMSGVDWAPATVVGAVRALAGDLAEHLRSPAEVRELTERLLAEVQEVPRAAGQRTSGHLYSDTRDFLSMLRRRAQLLPLVEAYDELKRRHDSLDYGDQVALAAQVARDHPAVGEAERERWDVVLLDEYQDTGTAQRVLLSRLFGAGHPVTAVGDPCQSIYGWRGASAGNLRRFAGDFRRADGSEADQVDLTTSFRNGGRILSVANDLSTDLRRQGVPVHDLRPGPKGADSGQVVHAVLPDADAEAAWIADRVSALVKAGDAADADAAAELADADAADAGTARYRPGDVAVLARARSQFPRIEQELRARGIPVEVSGIGGLLSTPEVSDVVATLAVVGDPTAGPAALRLLTGARWRLGPRDLDALARRARQLARPADEKAAAALREARDVGGGEAVDDGSLVEALDDPGSPGAYSANGWARISALRRELRGLRSRSDQPLADLVADVVRTTRLDVEVAARPGSESGSARAHLDRFVDVAAEFAETDEAPSIAAFLGYLEAAAEHERGLDLGRIGVAGDAVQLLTMHGAKGLEWPVVVVPGLSQDVFPGKPRETSDWCGNAKVLPFALRGDASDLPVLEVTRSADQKQLREALGAHKDACRAREQLEERRLMYVAATRAEDLLLCSGYWWDHTSKPRGPSAFLLEIRETCERLGIGEDAGWAPQPGDDEPNPLDREPREASWPADPFSPDRRAAVEQGAALVRQQPPGRATGSALDGGGLSADDRERAETWDDEVAKLLAERAESSEGRSVVDVDLPSHLSVSQLVALRRDPAALARRIRRPVPMAPAPLARRGTAFHAWLEQRYQGGRLLDIDELPGSADAGAAPDADLAALRSRFLTSEWADRQPVEGGVEVPFEMSVEGVLVRGRMDAVFRAPDGSWDVVDWKTGQRPTGEEAAAAAVQLAAYRLAWHRLTGVPLDEVRAGFHYVRTGETVRPVDLLDEDGLAALVRGVPLEQPATAPRPAQG